jgi:uncharacterized protein YjiS (DUF1127 family)
MDMGEVRIENGLLSGRARRGRGWVAMLVEVQALWRSRRRLATLDDAALRDLGLTRAEAMTEAGRALWDVPAHWLK